MGSPTREELERAIEDEPYGAELYAVYGDLLQREGDPRGELIALQLAAERDPARARDAAAYLQRHADRFVGDLRSVSRDGNGDAFRWRFGFIHGLRIQSDLVGPNQRSMADKLARVRAHPSGRFVTELAYGPSGFFDEELVAALEALAASPPRALRMLHFGCVPRRNPSMNFWHMGARLDVILAVVPRLRRLIERRARLPELEFLEVTGDHDDSIETLYIRNGRTTVSRCNGSFDDIAPLLARTDLPMLRHLGITNALFTDEICAALPGSALLSQLEVLDLSHGFMTDDGARALAADPEAFAHLHRLDVSKNYLTQAGIDVIAGLARRVITTGQR